MSVSGDNDRQITISDLNPSTTYYIRVAAENSAGIGMYSTIEATTDGKLCRPFKSWDKKAFKFRSSKLLHVIIYNFPETQN